MKLKITIYETPSGRVLSTGVYEVAKEGDLENAVSAEIAKARAARKPGDLWNFSVSVEKADG